MAEPTRARSGAPTSTSELEARIAELEARIAELEQQRIANARRVDLIRRFLPPEATEHFRAAAREQLRGMSVMLDHWVRGLEANEVEQARTSSGTERIVIE